MEDTAKKLRIESVETILVTYDIAITHDMLGEIKKQGLDINNEIDLLEIASIIQNCGDWVVVSKDFVERYPQDEIIMNNGCKHSSAINEEATKEGKYLYRCCVCESYRLFFEGDAFWDVEKGARNPNLKGELPYCIDCSEYVEWESHPVNGITPKHNQ